MGQHRGMVEVSVGVGAEKRSIPGPFSFKSGGQLASEASRRFPGHMLPATTYTGPPARENIVLRRADDLPQELMDWLEGRIEEVATVVHIKLDRRKKPWRRHSYSCTLLRVEQAEYDAQSTEADEIEFEFAVDG